MWKLISSILGAVSIVALASGNANSEALVSIDKSARPELSACKAQTDWTADCHVHDGGTYHQLTVNRPTQPHASIEFNEFRRALHGR
ncbi:hypothetical protein [Azospirillum agricola]|uniref:hypothetical protein n=1 Tax=Azospirillum agricola TaxID=1720247 RepID=UPI0011789BDB|nr:hypothetical protein [Azospirillum agricola]